jgi:hypothetical protein
MNEDELSLSRFVYSSPFCANTTRTKVAASKRTNPAPNVSSCVSWYRKKAMMPAVNAAPARRPKAKLRESQKSWRLLFQK